MLDRRRADRLHRQRRLDAATLRRRTRVELLSALPLPPRRRLHGAQGARDRASTATSSRAAASSSTTTTTRSTRACCSSRSARGCTLTAIGLLTTKLPDGRKGFSFLIILSLEFDPPWRIGPLGDQLGARRAVRPPPRARHRRAARRAAQQDARRDPLPDRPGGQRGALHGGAAHRLPAGARPARRRPHRSAELGRARARHGRARARLRVGRELAPGADGPAARGVPAEPARAEAASSCTSTRSGSGTTSAASSRSTGRSTTRTSRSSSSPATSPCACARATTRSSSSPSAATTRSSTCPRASRRCERLTISLADSENLRLMLTGYLAITSNTRQIGAELELFVKIGQASASRAASASTRCGRRTTRFVVVFDIEVKLKYKGTTFFGVVVSGRFTGPSRSASRRVVDRPVAVLDRRVVRPHVRRRPAAGGAARASTRCRPGRRAQGARELERAAPGAAGCS